MGEYNQLVDELAELESQLKHYKNMARRPGLKNRYSLYVLETQEQIEEIKDKLIKLGGAIR